MQGSDKCEKKEVKLLIAEPTMWPCVFVFPYHKIIFLCAYFIWRFILRKF